MDNFKTKSPDLELIYKEADGVKLPLHTYFPNGNLKNAKTVVCIHGGGWTDAITDNSLWQGGHMANNAKYLAEKGFIGITISYRSLKISPNLTVCDIIKDVEDAIYYMRKHLKFINFDNIVYMGDSAGGYLAVMLGLSQNKMLRPDAVVALNPVVDVSREKWEYAFKNCNIKNYSPFYAIGKNCAKFLFLHGTGDTVVELEDTANLHNKLRACGHCSEMITVANAKHAFMLYDYQSTDEFVTEYMDQIIKYLNGDAAL